VTSDICPVTYGNKCCTNNKCSTPSGSGICVQTSACSGTSVPGYCAGPYDLQCCISGTPSTDITIGYDFSSTLSSSSASCLKSSGAGYVIPRGYQSNCKVDTQVCTSIKNAYSAGIKTRDIYMFPSPTCSKSSSSQLSELYSYIKSNCMSQWSGRIWLDIEGI